MGGKKKRLGLQRDSFGSTVIHQIQAPSQAWTIYMDSCKLALASPGWSRSSLLASQSLPRRQRNITSNVPLCQKASKTETSVWDEDPHCNCCSVMWGLIVDWTARGVGIYWSTTSYFLISIYAIIFLLAIWCLPWSLVLYICKTCVLPLNHSLPMTTCVICSVCQLLIQIELLSHK